VTSLPDSLRMSALRTYLQCPKRFELQVLDGAKGEPKSERLRVGTALDRTVRDLAYLKRDVGGLALPFDQRALDRFLDDHYDAAGDEEDYTPAAADDSQHIMAAARRVVSTIGQIIAQVKPVLIDAHLSRSLHTAAGTPLDVTATIDLSYRHHVQAGGREAVGDKHHLRDVKMSGKGSKSWGRVAAAQDFQLTTYAWVAEPTHPVDTQGWIVGRALKKDTQVLHEAADVTPNAITLTGERLGMLASSIETSCETGVFLPTAAMEQHWSCQAAYCPFWERVCEHGKRAQATYAMPEAVGF
jgi:hypothetical protein